jgi:hypothetical protein
VRSTNSRRGSMFRVWACCPRAALGQLSDAASLYDLRMCLTYKIYSTSPDNLGIQGRLRDCLVRGARFWSVTPH